MSETKAGLDRKKLFFFITLGLMMVGTVCFFINPLIVSVKVSQNSMTFLSFFGLFKESSLIENYIKYSISLSNSDQIIPLFLYVLLIAVAIIAVLYPLAVMGFTIFKHTKTKSYKVYKPLIYVWLIVELLYILFLGAFTFNFKGFIQSWGSIVCIGMAFIACAMTFINGKVTLKKLLPIITLFVLVLMALSMSTPYLVYNKMFTGGQYAVAYFYEFVRSLYRINAFSEFSAIILKTIVPFCALSVLAGMLIFMLLPKNKQLFLTIYCSIILIFGLMILFLTLTNLNITAISKHLPNSIGILPIALPITAAIGFGIGLFNVLKKNY